MSVTQATQQPAKVPSNLGTDNDIKALLRLCEEPITLFGEDARQRKVRLQKYIKLFITSLNPAATAYLNRLNGAVNKNLRQGAAATAVEVKLFDTFAAAPSSVVDFRRKLLDATIERQKVRFQALNQYFLQQLAEVAKLPPPETQQSEDAAAALITGKSVSATIKQQQLHANAKVHPLISERLRNSLKANAASFTQQLTISAPGEDSQQFGVIHATQTTAAINPSRVQPRSLRSSSADATELAIGYSDGRVWLYSTVDGDLLSNRDPEVNGLSQRGSARVNSLCWRPQQQLTNSISNLSVSNEGSDILFVARRQHGIEMWRIDRHDNLNVDAAEDENDNALATVSAPKHSLSAPYSVSSSLVATLDRHVAFVNRLACDPSGLLLVSTSDDMTACLWDLTTSTPNHLYQQDGHDTQSVNNSVWAVDFHPDGAAFATSDLAGVCLVWDTRSGNKVAKTGVTHTGRATALKWFPTGFHMATAGDDGIVHVYDLRKSWAKPLYSIAAHTDSITSLDVVSGWNTSSFASSASGILPPQSASSVIPQCLLTAGIDGRFSMWSADDGNHLRTLLGSSVRKGEGVTSRGGGLGSSASLRFALAVPSTTSNGPSIITGARDRFWSIWRPDREGGSAASDSGDASVAIVREPVVKRFAAVALTNNQVGQTASTKHNQHVAVDKASDSSDSDDDAMAMLRKKPRVEKVNPNSPSQPKDAATAHIKPQAKDEDSDSDDDALAMLRKK